MHSSIYYHFVVTLPVWLLLCAGWYGIFKKAGKEPWKAFVPILNFKVLIEIVGRPNRFFIWVFIPVLNMIAGITLTIDILRSFGKHKFHHHLIAVIAPFLYFLYLGFNKADSYIGMWVPFHRTKDEDRERGWQKKWKLEKMKKGEIREWLDAILFAGSAAMIIRTFLIEAFMIPTTSMEGSLLAGDFLFVSKFHYGVRMPMVPLCIPFVHNTFPFSTSTKSYLNWIELPYSRTPGLTDIKRNSIVVFNYPDDDRNPDVDALGSIPEISMKQNYIKRCVAVAGDTLEIIDQQLFINGKPGWKPEFLQYKYLVWDPKYQINKPLLDKLGFRTDTTQNSNAYQYMRHGPALFSKVMNGNYKPSGNPHWELHMTAKREKDLRDLKLQGVIIYRDTVEIDENNNAEKAQYISIMDQKVEMFRSRKSLYFPKEPELYQWTDDNFGPLWIPKAGATITLDRMNFPKYEKCISVYEGHELKEEGGKYFIDGKEATTYTFELNYYFMMGDNRHGSLDSRFWGFVPETHILGKPLFVVANPWEGRYFKSVSQWEP